MMGGEQGYSYMGMESVLDLTLVSNNLASKCKWEVWGKSSIGSDHRIVIMLDIETVITGKRKMDI